MTRHFHFTIEKEKKGSAARAGTIHTPHGDIPTPAFIAVGTKATVKSLTPEMLQSLGVSAVLANTYHLLLEPGVEIVRAAGGFAKFMNWDGPTMTDSGGFQVFSLGEAFGRSVSKVAAGHDQDTTSIGDISQTSRANSHVKPAIIDEDGVTFTSHIDGSKHLLSPEISMQAQWALGADIIFAFDECTSPHATDEYQRLAMNRTHRWAKRSLAEHNKLDPENIQALFGVVQGGRQRKLREESARTLSEMDFDGFGIGGSFDKDDMNSVLGWVNNILPTDRPKHLLGIGEPNDICAAVEAGCDTFDCVAPTRNARNGSLYIPGGRLNTLNTEYRTDLSPIDSNCHCYTCTNFTRAYLSHLFRSHEILAATLASIHNLYFLVNLTKTMRQDILNS